MGILRNWLGPGSKYERDIPYGFEAQADALDGHGRTPALQTYYCDTLCGLVELLAAHEIRSDEVEIFAVCRDGSPALECAILCDELGGWLQRPALCRALESYYRESGDARYRGHLEQGRCRYADRERRGMGPW